MVGAPAPSPMPAGVSRRAPPHPGRFLERHYLKPLAMTQTEAAKRLGVSRRRVNELIQGHRSMTPDTAIRCALAFGLPAADWLAMQAAWDSFQTWKTLRRAARNASAGR
jgi:antitoxin HigA-1